MTAPWDEVLNEAAVHHKTRILAYFIPSLTIEDVPRGSMFIGEDYFLVVASACGRYAIEEIQ